MRQSARLSQQGETPTSPPIVSLTSMPQAPSPKGAAPPSPSLLGQEEEAPFDLTFFQSLAVAMGEFDPQFFDTHENFDNFGGCLLFCLGKDSSNLGEEDYNMGGGGLESIMWPTELLHFPCPPGRHKKRRRKEKGVSFHCAWKGDDKGVGTMVRWEGDDDGTKDKIRLRDGGSRAGSSLDRFEFVIGR